MSIKWFKLADTMSAIEWQANDMCIVELNGKEISLAKRGEAIFAFAHKCPHAGGILADGCIKANGTVECPLHRYQFNLSNGRNTSGEGYYLKTYPVEMREDGIYIGFEEKSWFSRL